MPMSGSVPVPKWFRILYRLSAAAVVAGLVCAWLCEAHGVRWLMPVALSLTLAGPPVFLLTAWLGVGLEWVRPTDAVCYSLLFVGSLIVLWFSLPNIQ
mgnify:CR=1 FL=1